MEDPRWLRLITIGLVLSTLAVGYFLLTGRFASTKINKTASTALPTQRAQAPSPSPTSFSPRPSPTASGVSKNSVSKQVTPSTVGQTTGGQSVAILPNTGFPVVLLAVFSASAITVGWGLRKYPN